MADNVTEILLRARMEVSGVEAGVGQIQKSLKGLTLPKGISDELEKSFGKLTPLLRDYQKQLNKGFSTKKDLQNFSALKEKITETFGEIRGQIQIANSQEVRLKVDTQEIDKLENKIVAKTADLQKALNNVFTKSVNSANIDRQLNDLINNTKTATSIKPMANMAKELFNTQDYAAYNAKLDEMRNKILSLSTTKIKLGEHLGVKDAANNLDAVEDKINKFFETLKVNEGKVQTIERLKQELSELGINLDNLKLESLGKGADELTNLESVLGGLASSLKQTGDAAGDAGASMVRMVDEVNQLKTSTQYFFSLRNMLNLLKRGIREAVDTVKDLDKAMTETAVVTEFSVGDMWAKLPEYTANANALGATIQDMYESTTLYYQQGLNTEQAMSIATETMKMARIAGMEAAEATDMMTAALRGFNMEINETSAEHINDVYSNLAAKTASNTEELGTAMQRTASIAHSAGMSFEGTAAFLAQAIETTREPAENLGTAMKTIVARFQELKKNPLEITEVDGEEVSYNKVDTALQSIGVSLKDVNGQFRDLDQVFLDIAQRWDGLSQVQQRYIATTAAGSRQQSRFIAMMSNYDRTMELMGYANDSAGASNEQFGKTMESLEAKLNKFRNAWQEFTMNIANNAMVKWAVDTGTTVLGTVNKIIEALSRGNGVVKSFLSLFTAFTGLKGFGRLANIGLGGLAGMIDPNSSLKEGLKTGLSGFKGNTQARAITNPIVAAIHSLIPHIDKAAIEDGQYKYQQNGNYKEARGQLAQNKNSYTIGGMLDIIDANKLNKQQQKSFFQSSPGLKHNLTTSLSNLFTEVGMDPKVSRGLIQGFKSGDLALDEVLTAKSLSPEQVTKMFVPEGTDLKLTDQYIKIQEQAMHDVAASGLTGEEADKAVEALTNQRWTTASEAIPKEFIERLKETKQELTGSEKLANGIGKVGAGLTSLGYSAQILGAQLGKVNPVLGDTISSMGGLLTAAGSLVNIIPQLIAMGPAAIIAVAGLAAFGISQYHSKKIKKAAEDIVNTYSETTKEITEKVNSLKSAQKVFDELSRGIDKYGNNVSLTEEDYTRYLETVDDVAAMAPELIRGYDAQGHAILATGSAIDELIAKEEELKKQAIDTFIDDSSINSLVAGIQESDAFKKYNKKESIYDPTEGIYKSVSKQAATLERSLAKAGITNFNEISKQLFGKEINLLEPSNEDLHLLSEHYNDIINLIESENQNLTDKQKQTLRDAFSGLGEGWESMTAELQPLSQAIGQYLSSEGLDTIGLNLGEEFTESFNAGLESLTMTAAMEGWDSSKIKEEARNYAEGFKNMTKEGSTYANIMEKVTAEQEKYNDSIGEPGAIENYKDAVEDYATELEQLADSYDDGTVAGELFANSLRAQANAVRNYATDSIISLGQALNTLSDEFASARGAEERFKKAIESGDYYTAAEGYKSIIDTVLDEKNVAGNGSIAGWTGAEEILGTKFVDSHNWDEVVDRIKSIAPMFEDGISGVQKFGDFLVEAAGESGKELKGLGEVLDDGLFHFNFDLEEGELEQFANKLGISTDALAALIDKSRQFVAWNISDMPQVRMALEQSGQSMVGSKGRLYTSEASFRAEAKQQGIFGDDYQKTKKDLQKEQNVEFLTVKSLTTKDGDGFGLDKVLADIGLTGADKTLDNTVAALSKMGFELEDQKKILTADGIKLADGAVTDEQIEQAYNEQAYALENPTVAGIADDTGVIASAATAILASMGILTESTKKDIENSISKDNLKGYTDLLHQDFTNNSSRNNARAQVESQIADYQSTIGLLKQGLNDNNKAQLEPYIKQLEDASEYLQKQLDSEQSSWESKLSEYSSIFDNINDKFVADHAIDFASAFAIDDIMQSAEALRQLENEGHLSYESMRTLAAEFMQLHQAELMQFDSTQLDALATKLGLTKDEAIGLLSTLKIPFALEGRLTGDDLVTYIQNFEGLTDSEKTIFLQTDISGEEKAELLIDKINNEFGDGDQTTKSVIIQATTALANGDQAGAEKILADAGFKDGEVQEITQKLSILVDGSVANPDEVKAALQRELSSLQISTDVRANISTNINKIGTKVNVDTGAIDDAKNKADSTTGTMTVDANTQKAQDKINKLRDIKDASITVNAKKGTGWTQHMTVIQDKHARGRNYSIPAHKTISFGSAAGGMNIPKTKKSSKRSITALVGEKGYEVGYIPSEQRSVIFGANGPEMTSFPSDTIIYPHNESQEILRRGKRGIPTFGSFEYGNSGAIPTSGSGGGTVKAAKKAAKDVSKAATNSEKAIGNVIVWWDNIARKTEVSQRKMDSALKNFEKFTKEMRATLRKTGESLSSGGGGGDDYLKKISDYMGYNQAQLDRANRELQTLDVGGGGSQKNMKSRYGAEGSENIAQISYKKGKKSKEEFVNLAGYIKAQNGTYVVDQAALNSISNAEKRKAVADAANKEIDDRLSKKYKAEDAIEKAQEAIEKMAEELYKTFFAWENELTKIWNLTKKIEATENNISRIKTYEETLNKQITTGLAKSSDRNHMAKTMEVFRQGLAESTDKIKTQTNLIEQQKKALQDALSIEDERTTLASIQAKLNQRQALDNITAQASSALSSARSNLSSAQQRAASKQSQIASLKAQKKKAKKKSKKNKIQNQINAAQNELNSINSTISYYQTQVNNATAAYNQAVANATNYLNNTEKLAYEQYAKTLQDQIEAQTAAQKYLSVRAKADGTVEVTFDTDAFEADKLQGSFTEDRAKAIQEYVKKIEETSADLSNAYKDANASVNELYDQLEQLENEWAEYANELWDIHEKEVKVQTDNFKKLSDSITKALKDLLDEVKRKLDERRKQEDNAKTERDISQKQQRLAALRADTAGGHQVEIAQLEREIADAQQNYQRTLEDQLLDKLQQQADLAAQQRERQIELQEAIVEGVNNAALVDLWMSNPEAYRDEIYEAYKLANEYDKKPEALRDQLDTKFEDLMAGLTTNQDKQEAVVDAIGDIQSTIDKIAKSLLLMTTDITNAKSNGFSVSEAQSLLNASYSDLRTQGGYTAEDFAQSEVSYSQARQAFSAEELKSNSYYAQEAQNEILDVAKSNLDKAWSAYYYSNKGTVDAFEQAKIKAEELGIDTSNYNTTARTQQQKDAEAKRAAEQAAAARQAKINTYNAAIAAAHKAKTVTKATLADAFNKGAAIGYGVDAVARALAAGDGNGGVTWKEVAKAAKQLGYGRTTVASWSPGSSALKNATTKSQWKKYAEGGLADYTGLAWLDGTPSKPELVLNAKDTENFLILKDILRSALKSTGSINNSYDGDATYEININVDHLNNDYDVDKVAERVKKIIVKDSSYRNVTQVRNLR